MLIAHMHDMDIPICCGFPGGSDSCLPLIEGAPCSLDVTADHTSLTFNIDGEAKPCEIMDTAPQITKVHYSILK
jgi:muramoyltetrapeptide carboxypeptidase